MDLGLGGKRALIAGSSKGIGRAIAVLLAEEGARVTICARGEDALRGAAEAIRAGGGDVLAVAADLATDEGVERAWGAQMEGFGGADVLVNNVTGIASTAGRQPDGPVPTCGPAKAALINLSKQLANTYSSQGVLTNCVCPGITRTEAAMAAAVRRTGRRDEDPARVFDEYFGPRRPLPAGRFGEPEDTASLVALLCSPRASWITGTCIDVDGGWVKSIL